MIRELTDGWRQAGVQDGDVLLVHSNVTRILVRHLRETDAGRRQGITAQDILESFLQAVGPSGTLLLPLFNFDFTSGIPFDIRNTPSQMGVLTEAGRLHPKAIRTGHPIYSFAAIGRDAERFSKIDNFSGYGKDSPFGVLHEINGKMGVLDFPDMTFYHYVEEMHNVDYRYHKTFTGFYTDASGNAKEKTYGLFVRDLERNIQTDLAPAEKLMWEKGLYSGFKSHEGCGLRIVRAKDMFAFVSDIITSGKALGTLYRIGEAAHHE